jgi:hypothetical protein
VRNVLTGLVGKTWKEDLNVFYGRIILKGTVKKYGPGVA